MKFVFTNEDYHGAVFFKDPVVSCEAWVVMARQRFIHPEPYRDLDRIGIIKRIILSKEPTG